MLSKLSLILSLPENFVSNVHHRLVTEWRIQKRVEEQFNAFIQGFHELIPSDLVNVFDERELELLIGGISEIDVDDWAKNTDYRGYDEKDPVIQNFWKVRSSYTPSSVVPHMLISFYSVSAHGTLSKNLVYCNSQLVPPESLSTASRICKEVTVPVASRSRSQARRVNCPSRILVSTVSTCRRTRHTKRSTPSFYGLSRRQLASDRSRKKVLEERKFLLYHLRIIRGRYQCGFYTLDQSSEKEIRRSFLSMLSLVEFESFFWFLWIFSLVYSRMLLLQRRRNVHYC